MNGQQIKKALSIIKISVAYFVDSRQVDGVFAPDKLLLEDKNKSLVIVSPHHIPYINKINKNLEEWGRMKDNNFINFVTDDIIKANQEISYFDPFLGFSQIRDIEGFYLYGDLKCQNKIVLLGNCTSLPNKLGKSWVDWFADKFVQGGGRKNPAKWGMCWLFIFTGSIKGYSRCLSFIT